MAEKYLPGLLQKICRGTFGADTLININFPNVPFEQLKGITVCRHGSRRFTPDTIENGRLKADSLEGVPAAGRYPDDCTAIKDSITVSALKIDLTDEPGLGELLRLLA